MNHTSNKKVDLAFYINELHGGGAERMFVNLMQNFVFKGLKIDLVVNRISGPYFSLVPPEVRIVDLGVRLPFRDGIPKLIGYMRRERPPAILTTLHPHLDAALIAKIFSFTSTRVIVREASVLSLEAPTAHEKARWAPFLVKFLYPWVADEIIAVSKGVAEDLMQITGLSSNRIKVIYNPTITPVLKEKATEPVDHPWFNPGEPPVILAVGRLEPQKDYPTLFKAFALVRQKCKCRLVILGKGREQENLSNLLKEMGLEKDVAMLNFIENPYKYIAKTSVFVLSSAWEGLPNVLIEALALGTPVVSTDCQSGPAEILAQGKYGWLVPVGDSKAMSEAILEVLSGARKAVDPKWLEQFTVEKSSESYLNLLLN